MSDSLQRMRLGNPVTDVGMPPIEPVLERLDHASASAGPRARRVRMRRPAAIAVVIAGLLLLAAVALAASGILTGEPVKSAPWSNVEPTRGIGVPIASGTRLLDMRAADPGGGPDWGLRLVETTRGLGCLQVGRVVDGRLGVLGQDEAFGNDGRFHELPPAVMEVPNCVALDGAGRTYVAVAARAVPASAMVSACAAKPFQSSRVPVCPAQDERVLRFGLLGPEAVSVTYEDRPGNRITQLTVGPEGAYLIVLRATPSDLRNGGWVTMSGPGTGLESVHYRDGRVCRIRSARVIGGAKACPPVGYVPVHRAAVTSAQVATPVRARVLRHRTGPRGTGYPLRMTLRARVAARGTRAEYMFFLRMPRGGSSCGYAMGGPLRRDIAAGSVVRQTVYLDGSCHGRVRGRVSFHYASGPSAGPMPPPMNPADATVGTFTVDVP